MTTPQIYIVDYGVGNLWSVLKAVRQYAPSARISEDPEELRGAQALILPGVGAFKAGMEGLRVRGLVEVLMEHAAKGTPMLGICLGAQLLLETGVEGGEHQGLGIIPGRVEAFVPAAPKTPVPIIEWLPVTISHGRQAQALFRDIADPSFYFVHSYILKPANPEAVYATATYGGVSYAAAIGQGKVWGTQFHPEKSGIAGLTLLKNFIDSVSL